MEVCVPFTTFVSHDISGDSGSGPGPRGLSHYDSRHLSVDELGICLTNYLNIEENKISLSGCTVKLTEDDTVDSVNEDKHKDFCETATSNSASKTCLSLSKSATFPLLDEPESCVDGFSSGQTKHEVDKAADVSDINVHATPVNQCYSHSISLPTPTKLVSAIKGSREKQDREPKKLSVTWAPDVYDPVPTSVSHVPSNKHYQHRSDAKKYAKSKHKSGGSKSSRGKSKDKKQPRKSSGSSTSKLRSLQSNNGAVGFSESEAKSFYYNSVNLDWDLYCGSGFLKRFVSEMHFTVTEATK